MIKTFVNYWIYILINIKIVIHICQIYKKKQVKPNKSIKFRLVKCYYSNLRAIFLHTRGNIYL